MTRLLTVCVAALALTASTAWAQPGPGGPMGGMMGGQGMTIMLLANPQVQKELEFGDDQKAKIKELGDKLQAEMREAFQGFRDLSQEDRQKKMEELRKKGEERIATLQAEVDKILLPHQKNRLSQIRVQVLNDPLSDAEIIKKLGINEEQKSKIEAIAKKARDANQKLVEGIRDVPAAERQAKFAELREKMDKARKDAQEEALAVLTDVQKAKLKELKGAAFNWERPTFPGGRGGNPPAPKAPAPTP